MLEEYVWEITGEEKRSSAVELGHGDEEMEGETGMPRIRADRHS